MKHGAVQTSTNKIKCSHQTSRWSCCKLIKLGLWMSGKINLAAGTRPSDVKHFTAFYSPRHIQQRISLVSQPLVLPRVVLVRAAASSGSIATVSWLQLVTWSPASAPPPPGSAPSAPRSLSPAPSPGPASAPPPPPPPPPSPGTWPLCWGWWRWPRWRRSRRSQSGLCLQQCWVGTAARSAARPGPWSWWTFLEYI